MRARWIVNGLLAAAVIALAALLWWSRTPAPPEPQPVSDMAADAIDHITVRHDNHLIELERDNTQRAWRMTAPFRTRPDPARIRALLALAAAEPERRYDHQAIDPSTTGVASPAVTVTYNDQAPIAIGHAGPRPGQRYIRTAHALLLVGVPDIAALQGAGAQWIDPRLLTPDQQLTRLTLPRTTLSKTNGEAWQAAPPRTARSRNTIRATLQAWQHARARSITAADASRARIARVTLRFADAPTRYLDVIAREPELILRDPALDIDYHLAPNHAPPMLDMQHPASLDTDTNPPE